MEWVSQTRTKGNKANEIHLRGKRDVEEIGKSECILVLYRDIFQQNIQAGSLFSPSRVRWHDTEAFQLNVRRRHVPYFDSSCREILFQGWKSAQTENAQKLLFL